MRDNTSTERTCDFYWKVVVNIVVIIIAINVVVVDINLSKKKKKKKKGGGGGGEKYKNNLPTNIVLALYNSRNTKFFSKKSPDKHWEQKNKTNKNSTR